MARSRRATLVAVAVATGLAVASLPANAALRTENGVTDSTVTFGITVPMSGIAAPGYNKVAPAAQAYLDYVNDNGGVNGRKIVLKVEDDRYAPATAVSKTNKLILQDKVFGLSGSLGTANHLAVLKSANLAKRGVPDLFVNTGYSGFDNPTKYPTTFTYLPSYIMEAKILGKYLASKYAGKKLALLYQDDDFGRDALAGFKIAGTTFTVSKGYASGSQSSPGLGAQIGAFQAAGAEVVVLFGVSSATGVALATAAKLGYKAQWILGSVGGDATTLKALGVPTVLLAGAQGASFLPSTGDDKDPYVTKFKEINDKYNKGRDKTWDNNIFVGMNMGMTLVNAVKAAGKDLTRKGLIAAIEAKGSTFQTAGLSPLGYSKSSHAGYTGYWYGTYDANGVLQPEGGKYSVWTTDSKTGDVVASTFTRPAMPANAIPTIG